MSTAWINRLLGLALIGRFIASDLSGAEEIRNVSMADLFAQKIVRKLSWPGTHAKAEYWVFQHSDGSAFAEVWKKDGGKAEELPKVDFEHESVVALFLNSTETHGHEIVIEKICLFADAEAHRMIALYRETDQPAKSAVVHDVLILAEHFMGKDGRFSSVNVASAEGKELIQLRDLKEFGLESENSKAKKEDKQ